MNYNKYFSQAEGRAKQYLHDTGDGFQSADGFSQAEGGFFSAPSYAEGDMGADGVEYAEGDDMHATGSDVRRMANRTAPRNDVSRPYIVLYQNTNAFLSNYVIFGSSANRTATNNGSDTGVTVSYGFLGYTYTQLLADSESKPFTLGRIRIDLLDTNTSNLTAPLSVTKTSSEGTVFTSPLTPYTALNQFITTAIEIPCNFEVDGDTSITGSLVATSSIRVSLFPATRASQTRLLNKKPELKGLGRPQIGAVQTIRLTQ